MGCGLKREKTPMRPDVDEQISRPDCSLQKIARRQFIPVPELIGDETVGARIGRELLGKAQMKSRGSVWQRERRSEQHPVVLDTKPGRHAAPPIGTLQPCEVRRSPLRAEALRYG